MNRSLAAFVTLLLAGAAATTSAAAPARRKTPARANRAAKPQATTPAAVPNPEISRVLEAYEAARPAEDELGLFKLDWAGSLKEAKERAAKEGRPVFFVATTQLERAGDLRGGHC